MDYLTFIAKLVEHLAWPIAAVTLATLLRKEIGNLLPFVKTFKAGPLEAEFAREMATVQETALAPDQNIPDVDSAHADRVQQLRGPDGEAVGSCTEQAPKAQRADHIASFF